MVNLLILFAMVIATCTSIIEGNKNTPYWSRKPLSQIMTENKLYKHIMRTIEDRRRQGIRTTMDDTMYSDVQVYFEKNVALAKYGNYANERANGAAKLGVNREIFNRNNKGNNKHHYSSKRKSSRFYLRSFKKLVKNIAQLYKKFINEIGI